MAINRPAVNVAMSDGTDHENVRLNLTDQVQWSRTARARGWKVDDQIMMLHFMAWHALKRTGLSAVSFEDFQNGAADWVAEVAPDETDEDGTADPADPTQ